MAPAGAALPQTQVFCLWLWPGCGAGTGRRGLWGGICCWHGQPALPGGSSRCHHLPAGSWPRRPARGSALALAQLPHPAACRGSRAGIAAFAREPPAGFGSDMCPSGRAGGGDSRLQPPLPGAKERRCWPRRPSRSSRGLWPVPLVCGLPRQLPVPLPAACERPRLGATVASSEAGGSCHCPHSLSSRGAGGAPVHIPVRCGLCSL